MKDLLQKVKDVKDKFQNEFTQETALIENVCAEIMKEIVLSKIDDKYLEIGQATAYKGVELEIFTIKKELERKGIEVPKQFSVLEAFIQDRMSELQSK